jgi:hypothetical protein
MPSTKLILAQKKKQEEAKKESKEEKKTDLVATPKRESTAGGIHAGKPPKVKDIELKEKPKVKIKPKQDVSGGIHAGKPKKKPRKDYEGPIIKGIKKIITKKDKAKVAQAAEVEKGRKSSGPPQKKKLSAVSGKEKAKKKADAKAKSTREEARKPKKAEAKKQAETGTRETSYEARVKALVAKKASLSKKETADGRSEYQVKMNKLKKEDKKAWKKMFKGGKLKG